MPFGHRKIVFGQGDGPSASVRLGSEPAQVLLGLQDRFGTRFLDNPAWHRARTTA